MDHTAAKISNALLGVIVFIGILACYKVADLFSPHRDFWDVATAIGTCGAVIAALAVVFIQDRQQRRNAAIKAAREARVLATLLDPQLLGVYIDLRKAVTEFDEFQRVDPSPVAFRAAVNDVVGIQFRLTVDQLVMLLPLPSECAAQLAGCFGRIDAAANYVRFVPHSAFTPRGNIERKAASERMHVLMFDAYALLHAARQTLKNERIIASEQIEAIRALAFRDSQRAD